MWVSNCHSECKSSVKYQSHYSQHSSGRGGLDSLSCDLSCQPLHDHGGGCGRSRASTTTSCLASNAVANEYSDWDHQATNTKSWRSPLGCGIQCLHCKSAEGPGSVELYRTVHSTTPSMHWWSMWLLKSERFQSVVSVQSVVCTSIAHVVNMKSIFGLLN